jgi:hypothetical protein
MFSAEFSRFPNKLSHAHDRNAEKNHCPTGKVQNYAGDPEQHLRKTTETSTSYLAVILPNSNSNHDRCMA